MGVLKDIFSSLNIPFFIAILTFCHSYGWPIEYDKDMIMKMLEYDKHFVSKELLNLVLSANNPQIEGAVKTKTVSLLAGFCES